MHKILKWIPVVLALLLTTSCSEDILDEQGRNKGAEGQVTFTIGVEIPSPMLTRAGMDGSETPTITELWVVAFSQDHYLKQSAKAEPVTTYGPTDPGDETLFNVTLNASDEPLIIHLVANYDLSALPFGQEGQVMGTLLTAANQDVYWQRVENVTVQNTNTDQSNTNVPAPDNLKRVPLVRNYAMITVNNTADNFVMTGYTLTSVPKSGTVAPRKSSNSFAQYAATGTTYANLTTEQNYTGNIPYHVELTTLDRAATNNVAPASYVFEFDNTNQTTNTMSVIVRGIYGSDSDETYYKVDLIYKEGNVTKYYNILRNFQYVVNIQNVTGSGYQTPEGAMSNPACNNIAGSTLVSSLTNVSDGTHQLYVDRRQIVIVNNNPVTFKYKYVSNLSTTPVTVSNDYSATDVSKVNISHNDNDNRVINSLSVASSDDSEGWRTVTIQPKDPSAQVDPVRRKITVATPSALMREIELIWVQPYEMSLSLDPNPVTYTYNAPVTLNLTIPAGLPESLFPLEFHISSDNNTIYPQANTDMPVAVTTTGKYYFVKTLTLAEYNRYATTADNKKVVPMLFMTNKQASGAEVKVTNTYFSDATATLQADNTNTIISYVSIEGTEYYGAQHDVVFKYKLTNSTNAQATYTGKITFKEVGATDQESTVNLTVARNTTSEEQKVTFKTGTFKGAISITIQVDQQTKTVTINNPKKRHILLLPKGSFTFSSDIAGFYSKETGDYKDDNDVVHTYTYYDKAQDKGNPRLDDNGNYLYEKGKEFEWPDFGVTHNNVYWASGSRKMYPTDGMVDSIAIDASYGGRDVEFDATDKFEFHSYYNYKKKDNTIGDIGNFTVWDADAGLARWSGLVDLNGDRYNSYVNNYEPRNPNAQGGAKRMVFETTVGAICDAYANDIRAGYTKAKYEAEGKSGAPANGLYKMYLNFQWEQ